MKLGLWHKISEKEIIQGCVSGDGKCQKLLYDSYASKMFSICLRYANNYHSAEDLLQEGFIKLFNKINTYRFEGSFEGWLKRIFINTALEHIRGAIHIDPIENIKGTEMNVVESTVADHLAVDELLKMIQELPAGYKTIFNLYAIEGYSHKEIAETLGISEGTSKSQLARARAMLQKMLLQLNKSKNEIYV